MSQKAMNFKIMITTAAFLTFVVFTVLVVSKSRNEVLIGVYDPDGVFSNSRDIKIENVYFDWNIPPQEIISVLDGLLIKQRIPLVTLEPWPREQDLSNEHYLRLISSGEYDGQIKVICEALSNYPGDVYIRWGHEMEQTSSRYFWSNKDPVDFVNGYKHFVTECRSFGDNLLFVWSPAGDKGLSRYWPGEEFVDVIGLSTFSYDVWERDYYDFQRSFSEVFTERYNRVKGYSKPVYIAELGVTGSKEYRRQWLTDAKRSFGDFPLLKACIYFNSSDVDGVWGQGYETPAWSIDPEFLEYVL